MSGLRTQMKMRDKDMVPRFLVQAMFTVMAASLALVAYARLTDRPLTGSLLPSPVVAEKVLVMSGGREETVIVTDVSGAIIARSNDGPRGFIGVISRSVALARKTHDLPPDGPVTLARHANGVLTISDPATGWSIELLGYGKDNIAAFARLLDAT